MFSLTKTQKILVLLFSLFVLFLSSSFAQEMLDVIETNDGSVYKGIIVENKINEYLRIEIAGGSTIRLDYDNVDTIKKERAENTSKTEKSETSININTTASSAASSSASGSSGGSSSDKGGTYQEGKMAGKQMAEGNGWWFFSGCALGAIGIVIPAVVEPDAPTERVMGKSPEYIQGFEEGYKAEAKKKNIVKSVWGCGASSLVGGIIYAVALSSVASASTY